MDTLRETRSRGRGASPAKARAAFRQSVIAAGIAALLTLVSASPCGAAATNTWLGDADADWGNSNNWDLGRAPLATDHVRIATGASYDPVMGEDGTVGALWIMAGTVLRPNGWDLNVTADADIDGTLAPLGSEALAFGGDVDFTGGVFSQGMTQVILGGAGGQSITSDGESFFGVRVTNRSGTVTFADAMAAASVTNEGGVLAFIGPASVTTFANEAGNLSFATDVTVTDFSMLTTGNVTIAGGAVWAVTNLSIHGTPSGTIALHSTTPGTPWLLHVGNWSSVGYVDVQDCDASGGVAVHPYLSTDSGNNTNWVFGDSGNWKRWNGSDDTSFSNGSNWTPAGAPDADTLALVDGFYANAPRLTAPLTIRALTVGGSTQATVTVDALLTVREDLTVLHSGTVTHSPSGATPLYMLDMVVGSDLNLEGRLDADGQGYRGSKAGPGAGGIVFGAVHGGRISNNAKLPYGSITAPTSLGSTAYAYSPTTNVRGGGAIRAVVSNRTVFINGVVTANAKSVQGASGFGGGAGGSVFLTTGSLLGRGTVRANGDDGGGHGAGSAGSGGRVSVVLTEGPDFGNVTIEAAGFPGGTKSPCGTVYLQTAAQGVGGGTLVIDNKGQALDTLSCTMIAPSVTDAVVGDVVIRNAGKLRIYDNLSLVVNGSFSNGVSFTADPGSTVTLGGTNEATLYGSSTFQGLVCTNGGKRLNFEEGMTYTVQSALTLKGAATNDGSRLVLRSTGADAWRLNMAAGMPMDVEYVDAQGSDASGGTAIEAYDSKDSGFNTNWVFGTSGYVLNAWNGSVSTDWGTAANWSLGRATLPGDIVLITNGCPNYPIVDTIKTISGLVVSNGASIALGGHDIMVTGSVTVAGALFPSGGETITLGGDVDFTGGVFSQGLTQVVLGGAGAQSITSDGEGFSAVRVTNTQGTVTFIDAMTAVSVTNLGGTLAFGGPASVTTFANEAGNLSFATDVTVTDFSMLTTGNVTVAGGAVWAVTNLSIHGTPAGEVKLRSASPGTPWRLDVGNWSSVGYVDVQDSDASGGLAVHPYLSTDSGNNTDWVFGDSGNWKRWTGAADTSFSNGSNWTPVGAPDADTLALIDGFYVNAPRLTAPLTIRALTVGGSTQATVTVDALLTVREDLTVLQRGVVTHSPSGATPLYMLDLIVGSDLNLEGRLDADGQGYRGSKAGPGAGGIVFGAVHGGRISNNAKLPYGSITAPTSLGSTAYAYSPTTNARGGGAIRAVVSNRTVFINGVVTANAKAVQGASGFGGGAGGSVFLTTGSLLGRGTMRANGDDGGGHGAGSAGSGGRVSVVLTDGDDFGAVAIEAAGFPGGTKSPCGTVYLQTAAQQAGYGTLIVDNKGQALDTLSCTMVAPSVTDAVVGDVVVRNAGKLRIYDNLSLTVNGSFSNGPAFTADPGSTVCFGGTNEATLYGSSTFQGLVCTNGGKRLNFEEGKTFAVQSALTLRGAAASPGSTLVLRSTGASAWRLNMAAGMPLDVRYVDVQRSDASGGAPIEAYDSVDAGSNTNWVFGASGPQLNAWNGSLSTDWGTAGNWSLGRATLPDDRVLITNGCPNYPILDAIKTIGGLALSNGASLRLGGYDITIPGDMTVAGALIPSGGETITLGGDIDFTGGVFSQGLTQVVLGGAGAQSITSDGESFSAVRVTNSQGTVTFGDAMTAVSVTNLGGMLAFSGPASVTTFANRAGDLSFAGDVTVTDFNMFTTGNVTVAGGAVWAVSNLSIHGTPSGQITLHSASPGAAWLLNVRNWSSVGYVDVQDSDASGGLAVHPYLSTDGGNNTNWVFGDSGNWKRWTGAADTSFNNGSNWTPSGAPDADTLALVDGFYSNAPHATSPLTIRALTVGGSTQATVTVDAPLTVREDLTVLQRGVVTHSPSGATPLYMLDLVVCSDLYLEGRLDADGQGYRGSKAGPGGGNVSCGAVHGSRASNNPNLPYGSITAPTTLGSTAYAYSPTTNARGGGAIRTVVSNRTVFIGGAMTSNAKSVQGMSGFCGSAGGSVLLTTGSLSGRGVIRANGDDGGGHGPVNAGGGGRVAVVLTDGSDFGAVAIEAAGFPGGTRCACGTVYLQTAAQGTGGGTLVIDNKGQALDALSCTMIAPSVTDAVVGDVVIRNAGDLQVYADQYLTVNGSWSNGSLFTAYAGSTVDFAGPLPALILSDNVFCNLRSVSAGKSLTFEAGMENTVTNSLILERVAVYSTTPGVSSYLTLSPGATQDVQRVSARDSDASNGQTIIGRISRDMGNNVNWVFTVPAGSVFLIR